MQKKKKHSGCLKEVLIIGFIGLLIGTCLLLISHDFTKKEKLPHRLSIVTYNTHRMSMYAKPNKNKVIRYLQQLDADVVFLQEVEVYKDNQHLTLPELRQAMSQYAYSYYDFKIYNKRRQYGIVVYSKYPLIHKQTIRYTSLGNISNFCDMVVGKDTFRLFNNHLESNHLVSQDMPEGLDKEHIKTSAQHISDKLSSARTVRHAQVQAIHEQIKASPYPVIVAGDFNDIPLSWTYLRMRGLRLRDSFLQGSRGRLGWTFSRHGLGIRIDYILCSRFFTPTNSNVEHVNYSDHYPYCTTLCY